MLELAKSSGFQQTNSTAHAYRQVAFLEAAHPAGPDQFRLYFGGADTVIGTAMVKFEKVAGVKCEA